MWKVIWKYLLKNVNVYTLDSDSYLEESTFRSKVAMCKNTQKRMSIGALFVVVKILKRPEWNTVQVILKNHFYIFDLEGCSECTVRKASRRETGIWWPHSYLKQTIQDALYVCMLIWLCRNVDDKERQERKGRKTKTQKESLCLRITDCETRNVYTTVEKVPHHTIKYQRVSWQGSLRTTFFKKTISEKKGKSWCYPHITTIW